MNFFSNELAVSEATEVTEIAKSDLQELNESQLTLVGGGNVIVTCG